MIKVSCFTNLDEFKQVRWPEELPVLPQKGDWIQGVQGNNYKRLKVASICHCINAGNYFAEIELTR